MMIHSRSVLVLFVFAIGALACPGGDDTGDTGEGNDIGAVDLGARDAGDVGSRDRDPPDADAEVIDLGVDAGIPVDGGQSGLGESCATAVDWPDDGAPFSDTTTRSQHREQLSCAGSGGAANAPELWWKLDLPQTQSVVLELGTDGWDGVLGVRTGTCTRDVESCADRPTYLELPAVDGSLFVAVDGYSTGNGRYALTSVIDEPWTIPPPNNSCTSPETLTPPATVRAHNFQGNIIPISPCGMISSVYYAIDSTGGAFSAVAFPSPSHDVELAIVSACGEEAIVCASTAGRGVAERIDRLPLPMGRWLLAVGTRSARPAEGSFTLDVREDALCTRDAECAFGEACIGVLSCAAELGDTVTSTVEIDIPDGGRVEIPLEFLGTAARITKIRARVAFEHPYPEDLVIELSSPPPSPIVVRLRDRSAYEADVTYGRERPADGPGHLADFGLVETATGTWTISIEDRAIGDRGFVTGVVLGLE
jgi:hypothetical protein